MNACLVSAESTDSKFSLLRTMGPFWCLYSYSLFLGSGLVCLNVQYFLNFHGTVQTLLRRISRQLLPHPVYISVTSHLPLFIVELFHPAPKLQYPRCEPLGWLVYYYFLNPLRMGNIGLTSITANTLHCFKIFKRITHCIWIKKISFSILPFLLYLFTVFNFFCASVS